MKQISFVLGLLFWTTILSSQKAECNEISKDALAMNKCAAPHLDSCVLFDLEKIYNCINFSATDKFVIDPEVIAIQLYQRKGVDTLTYGYFINNYNNLLHTQEYLKLKEFELLFNEFENRMVSKKNWDIFSERLEKADYRSTEIDSLKRLFRIDIDSGITFLNAYDKSVDPEAQSLKIPNEDPGFKEIFTSFDNLKLAQELSERQEKPILIYFLNHSDTISMNFTGGLVKDEHNLRLMQNEYISFLALLDIQKELNPYKKIALGINPNNILTKGEYFSSIMRNLTPHDTNAPLIIVLKQGQEPNIFSHHLAQPEELTEFLSENLR